MQPSNLQAMYRDMTRPQAGSLHCNACGARRSCTTEQAAFYLRQGWPECCGQTMTLAPEKPKEAR